MAFIPKASPFFGDDAVDLVDVQDNMSHSVAEAHDERGNIVAATNYGKIWTPRFSYRVKGDGTGTIILPGLGKAYTDMQGIGTWLPSYGESVAGVLVPESVTINTAFGSDTVIEVAARGFAGPAEGCPYVYADDLEIPDGVCAHAKIFFEAFALSGTGCYLNSANYTVAANIHTTAGADGEIVAWSAVEGRIEAAVTIIQTGSAKPVLAPGSGWRFVSPLTCANPQTDYPTWSATLRQDLENAEETSGT